jgi:hypothetical protein
VLRVHKDLVVQTGRKGLQVQEDHKEILAHKDSKVVEVVPAVQEPQEDKDSKEHKVLEAQVRQEHREHKELRLQDLQVLLVLKVQQDHKGLKVLKDQQVLLDPLVHLTLDLKKISNQLNLHFQKSSTLEG